MSGIIGGAGSRSGVVGETEIDYEEGTWTPADTNGNTTGTPFGMYTKIGNLVTASFHLVTGSLSGTSRFYITGLPFTSGSTDAFRGAVAMGYQNMDNLSYGGYVGNGATTAYLMIGGGNIAEDGQIGTGKTLSGTLFYRVA